MALAAVFMLSSGFSLTNGKENADNIVSSYLEFDFISILEFEKANEDVPCRWRICRYRINSDGTRTLIGCSGWSYGECYDNGDGTLTPAITLSPVIIGG